jgi:predicted aspartyl protease
MPELVVAAAVFISIFVPAADRPRHAVPLDIDGRGTILLDVVVNGSGPYRFLLDTGTSRSIVSDRLARELEAPVVAKTEIVSNAGTELRLVVSLASVAVAGKRVDRVLAPVLPDARLGEIAPGVRGVLGQDFLSTFNYTLDYRRARLTWDEVLTCGPDAVRLVAADGRFVMTVDVEAGGRLRLVPDSGADAPILFQPERQPGTTSRLGAVRVGGAALRNLAALHVHRRDPAADGLLPLHHFSSVSFAAGGACLVARK